MCPSVHAAIYAGSPKGIQDVVSKSFLQMSFLSSSQVSSVIALVAYTEGQENTRKSCRSVVNVQLLGIPVQS